MGRGKEPDQPTSNPQESKKYRDEAKGHIKNGNYDRALTSLDKARDVQLSKYPLQFFDDASASLVHAYDMRTAKVRGIKQTLGVSMTTTARARLLTHHKNIFVYLTCYVTTLTMEPGKLYQVVRKALENEDNAIAHARSILGPTKETEFLQSFVRIGTGDEEEEPPPPKPSISKRLAAPPVEKKDKEDDDKNQTKENNDDKPKKRGKRKQKRERRRREEEVYTDKDRAAAVVMGSRDIKLSLNMKDKAERSTALQLPVETDAGSLLALARAEIIREKYKTALSFVDKAIDLAPEEKAAYVARSKCYLLLGEPKLALADAETALKLDPKHAKALLNKAEALYYCGEFEMSLVHYHRGLRARPDLHEFRLGVQKAQEAIENTIGSVKVTKKPSSKRARSKPSRPALGQLMTDKVYLENLLKNPDLAIADKKNVYVVKQAEEAIKFLENREEFWRQQQTAKRH